MVVRSGRQVVTVDVFKETYDSLKKTAEYDRQTAKEFINFLLINNLTKLTYLNEAAPDLSVDSYGDTRITLKDSKVRKLIDVYLREEGFFCEEDNKTDCIHTKYVLASPKVTFQMLLNTLRRLREHMEKYSINDAGSLTPSKSTSSSPPSQSSKTTPKNDEMKTKKRKAITHLTESAHH